MSKYLCLLLCLSLTGCVFNPIKWLAGSGATEGTESKSEYSKEKSRVRTPVAIVVNSRGDKKWAYKTENFYKVTNAEEEVVPERTWFEVQMDRIKGLGAIVVFGVVIAMIVAPGATITLLYRWGRRNSATLRGVVRGVKESKMVEEGNGLHRALEANLDGWMTTHIKQIKARL